MATAMSISAQTVESILGAPRFGRYLDHCDGDANRAINLYRWNAEISAALVFPTHFAEVAVRNAVATTLSTVYGDEWPHADDLLRSLPIGALGKYSPHRDLKTVRSRYSEVSKIIPELKFAFWVTMFTRRHHGRLWSKHLTEMFPQVTQQDLASVRREIHEKLDDVRTLRNRIAHHEPIYYRDLPKDFKNMMSLINLRSHEVGVWVSEHEQVSKLLTLRPMKPGTAEVEVPENEDGAVDEESTQEHP